MGETARGGEMSDTQMRNFLIAVVVLVLVVMVSRACGSAIAYQRTLEAACIERGGSLHGSVGGEYRCIRPIDSVGVKP